MKSHPFDSQPLATQVTELAHLREYIVNMLSDEENVSFFAKHATCFYAHLAMIRGKIAGCIAETQPELHVHNQSQRLLLLHPAL